jgi:hypothetical protein
MTLVIMRFLVLRIFEYNVLDVKGIYSPYKKPFRVDISFYITSSVEGPKGAYITFMSTT